MSKIDAAAYVPRMEHDVTINRYGEARELIGNVVRFHAVRAGEPVFVEIDLIQWTLIRDRHPAIDRALAFVESLTAEGSWQTSDGVRSVAVAMGPLINYGSPEEI
ncbi:hypothetical protein [Sphingomonas crocodyli]|uniref:Uncharacterized protein n=1 Tax=Sphingomonas crocodyli TaxID=1979270 RepID=A0A437LXL3_9SPHN|nr:hypothetical protein [Sphingomonas crocodyli]RVT90139.1 hypothetical protein EOD43_17680 [Sphingomonas crocodyli]